MKTLKVGIQKLNNASATAITCIVPHFFLILLIPYRVMEILYPHLAFIDTQAAP